MKIREFHEPVRPDTYEASMALNQIMKIGKHAIKLHKLIDDSAEMEAWVQKKIDFNGYPETGDESGGRFIFVKKRKTLVQIVDNISTLLLPFLRFRRLRT